jgi:hypothetical protein
MAQCWCSRRPAQCARGPAWPSSASASAVRAAHGLAQLGQARAHAAARHECSTAVTSPAHGWRRGEKHGGASPACGRQCCRNADVDGGAWMARRGVDGGAAHTAQQRPTWDDCGVGQRNRDDARTRRRGILTGASDGVNGGVGDDGGVACSDTWSVAHDARRAAKLSRRRCRNVDTGDGAVGRRRLSGRWCAVPTAPLRHSVARACGSHAAKAR